MDLKKYHDEIWQPFSKQLDLKLHPYKPLRVAKALFDIHFTILGILGICATPKEDLDCYCYICKRTIPHKYQHLSWDKRLIMIKKLFRQALRA
jgi:hypothetical protein